MIIAIGKWIGTLAPTLLLGVVNQFNIFVILTGCICSVFDILYIVLLFLKFKEEKAAKALIKEDETKLENIVQN